jgi:hypothetical protein
MVHEFWRTWLGAEDGDDFDSVRYSATALESFGLAGGIVSRRRGALTSIGAAREPRARNSSRMGRGKQLVRTGWDSNPRYAMNVHKLSRGLKT